MSNEIDWMKVAFMVMHVTGEEDVVVTDEHYKELEDRLEAYDPAVIIIQECEQGTRVQLVTESEAIQQEADHLLSHPETNLSTRKH